MSPSLYDISSIKTRKVTMSDEIQQLEVLMEQRFGEKLPVPKDIRGAQTLRHLLARATRRQFSNEPVSPQLLRVLMACGLSAPSKSDLQQTDIIHVCDPGKRASIVDWIGTMDWIHTAPVFLVICGNGRRLRQVSELHGESFANDHFDAVFNPAVDAGLVLSHLLVACEAVGLATCPISVIRDHAERVSTLLQLPPLTFPVAGLCIGWPAEATTPAVVPRLSLPITTHTDTHDDESMIEAVQAYDRRRGRQTGWDPESPEFVGWSQQKAKMYAKEQRQDFGAYLRGQAFNLD